MKKFTMLLLIALLAVSTLNAQEINIGTDLVSRYIWRGMDFGKSPAIQPSLSLNYGGFEAGFWGSYTLNETASDSDELDAWISYSFDINSVSFTAIITDYYFPNNGIKFGNFNNHDDEDGAGAHTFEAGLSISSEKFPLSLSIYYNFYNDAGNNTYFQVDYPFNAKEVEINLFCGLTAGSDENPGYYGTEDFSVINVGIQASKAVKITENFSLPIFVSYSINPKLEQSYLAFGISL